MVLAVKFKVILTVLILAAIAHGVYAKAPERILKACYEDTEQFPYYMGDSDQVAEKPGVVIELLQLTAKKLNFHIKFIRLPWKRCLVSLKSGDVDIVFNSSFKKDRLQFGLYPMKNNNADPDKRIITLSYSFYALKKTAVVWNGEKVSGVKAVGAPQGFSIVPKLKKMGLDVYENTKLIRLMTMLSLGRIQLAALQTVTGDAILKQYPIKFSNIVKLTPPIVSKPYYVMLSYQFVNSDRDLANKIWNTLATLRETHLNEIVETYNNSSKKSQ